jgi:hypothetical protein
MAVYAKRCSCQNCGGRAPAWPLATYRQGHVFVPPMGVVPEALLTLLREAKVI